VSGGRLEKLLLLLVEKTQAGSADWKVSPHPYTYDLERSSGTVRLDTVDDDGARPYRLAVLRSADSDEVLDFIVQQWDQEEGEYTWPQLGHLYELARGHALKIDSVLDGLLEDLQGDQ
jgi:hypothetical protein